MTIRRAGVGFEVSGKPIWEISAPDRVEYDCDHQIDEECGQRSVSDWILTGLGSMWVDEEWSEPVG